MTKPNRCIRCRKIIRLNNKSQLCHYHLTLKLSQDKKRKKCHICEEPCSGKMLIEYRKGVLSSFCTYHFNILNSITDLKNLRKEIKRLRGCY